MGPSNMMGPTLERATRQQESQYGRDLMDPCATVEIIATASTPQSTHPGADMILAKQKRSRRDHSPASAPKPNDSEGRM